eukprot:209321-Chlamydomonas_euryale.AAC.11
MEFVSARRGIRCSRLWHPGARGFLTYPPAVAFADLTCSMFVLASQGAGKVCLKLWEVRDCMSACGTESHRLPKQAGLPGDNTFTCWLPLATLTVECQPIQKRPSLVEADNRWC